jgi:hypothetical protein
MLAWVLMNRHHLPRSPRHPRKSRLPRALGAKGSIRALPLPARLFNIPTFKPSNVQTCFPLSPAFSSDYEIQISQPLSLDIDTKCPGVYAPLFSLPGVFQRSDVRRYHVFGPILFLFKLLRTLLLRSKTQLFCFQPIRNSLPKNTRGWGGGRDKLLRENGVRLSVLISLYPYFLMSLLPFPIGNNIGSAGGLSAISSSCGYCRRSGSDTFTFDPFKI